ncbi:MAG: M23 family metallopeptidase [Anaerolineales bacterium]
MNWLEIASTRSGRQAPAPPRCAGRRSNLPTAFALLTFFSLCACQGTTASATSTPFTVPQAAATASATLVPTSAPTANPPAAPRTQTTYTAPTLAPFPLSAEQLQAAPVLVSQPGNLSAPLALSRYDHFYFSMPVASRVVRNQVPSQRYGVIDKDSEQNIAHLGLDLSINSRTPVLAAAPGKVMWASYGLLYNSVTYLEDPYGISVVILHEFGYEGKRLYTVYAHLSEAQVAVGDLVERGQVIALSGSTGQSSGPHLHFEVRSGSNTIYFTRNPELWIAPDEGRGTLVGRVQNTFGVDLLNRLVEVRSLESGTRRILYSYATAYRVLPDDYYDENLLLGDLPAGRYELSIPYLAVWRRAEIEIKPGAVTFFEFKGVDGFSFDLPVEPRPQNLPSN